MTKPLIAATCGESTLWVWHDEHCKADEANAQITNGKEEPNLQKAQSFATVTAPLNPEEWHWDPSNPGYAFPGSRKSREVFQTVEGKETDALIHDKILEVPDDTKLRKASYEHAKAMGLSEEALRLLK